MKEASLWLFRIAALAMVGFACFQLKKIRQYSSECSSMMYNAFTPQWTFKVTPTTNTWYKESPPY